MGCFSFVTAQVGFLLNWVDTVRFNPGVLEVNQLPSPFVTIIFCTSHIFFVPAVVLFCYIPPLFCNTLFGTITLALFFVVFISIFCCYDRLTIYRFLSWTQRSQLAIPLGFWMYYHFWLFIVLTLLYPLFFSVLMFDIFIEDCTL